MTETRDPAGRYVAVGYAVGLVTGLVVMGLVLVFVGWRVGGPGWIDRLNPWHDTIDLPQDVFEELVALDAVLSTARTQVQTHDHDTILSRPDPELESVLRPDVRVRAHMLRTTQPLNLDPPVLHLRDGQPLPPRVREFLRDEQRLEYLYTTDSHGHRTTLPAVDAPDRVLVVGDSVAFGVGVDDADTIPSQLQRLLGDRARVVNAAVGGYDGRRAAIVAEREAATGPWAGLVYVACQNDFHGADDPVAEAALVLDRLAALRDRFGGRMAVVLHTYMEYTLHDVLLSQGWKHEKVERTHRLRDAFPVLARERGFAFFDWTDVAREFALESGSVFAPFALYSDHCHLSPLGNRLLAERLLATLRRQDWELARLD